MRRVRADRLLVDQGHFPSRERAQAAIEAGHVTVAGRPVIKPSSLVELDGHVRVDGGREWVSRGAKKLLGALDLFPIQVDGVIALDAGASTGGFTELLLTRGARQVIAVDVGYGQLAWSLRQDPRVTVMERTNVRSLTADAIGGPVGLIVADLSFISLTLVMDAFMDCGDGKTEWVLLVKPQFEVGKGFVGKGGIVRDPELHRSAVRRVVDAASVHRMLLAGQVASPITGADGNQEFLCWFRSEGGGA